MRQTAQRGMTLVEVLVVTFIMSVVGLMIVGILTATRQFWEHGNAKLDAKFQAELALQRIVGELRNTMGEIPLTYYYEGRLLGFSPLTDCDGDGTVHNASNGQLEYDPNIEIRYYQSNNQLLRVYYDWKGAFAVNIADGTCRTSNNIGSRIMQTSVLADGVSAVRFIVNSNLVLGPCTRGSQIGWPTCPASQSIRVEVTSTEQVFDKGGTRPMTYMAATTLELRHDALPMVVPMATTVAVTQPTKVQGAQAVYTSYPTGSFPQ